MKRFVSGALNGVTDSGELVPLNISDDGTLKVQLTGSGNVVVSSEIEIKNDAGSPVPVAGPATDAQMAARGYALDGSDSTGVVQLAGGVGIRGWLSGIFNKLAGTLNVGVTTRVCLGTQTITALSSSAPASLTVPASSVVAEIQADGGTVRMRVDAGDPTATVGRRIDDGTVFSVDSVLSSVRLLAQSGSTTNVQITYFDRV